jgi:hypothetical protein
MRVSLRPNRNKRPNRAGPWLLAQYAGYEILHVDAFEWLKQAKRNSIHAVDTPIGEKQLEFGKPEANED